MEVNKMDSNKENVPRSKIPVPVKRTHSGRATIHDDVKTLRNPLKTITGQNYLTTNSAGSSKNAIDRHVTRRIETEDLDWQYKVFRDNNREATRTPLMSPPREVTAVKKVKSSLRRAHTRNLQGMTPVVSAQQQVQCPVQCTLTISTAERDTEKDFLKGMFMDVLNQNYTGDTMQYLMSMEMKVTREPVIKRAPRSCVINWIIKVDNNRSQNPAVVQSACWYLDKYLSIIWVPTDSLQLTAATCYWLATKFHGNMVSSHRLVKCSGDAFSPNKMVATEMNVLRKLQYSVPVVPHDFIPFLSWWCDAEASGLLESAATFICQCGVMVSKNLCVEYASVVAVACVQNALILLGKNELMERLESCPIYQKASLKARDLPATCAHLRACLRELASITYEYKAPVIQYSVAPHYVAPRIIKAVNSDEIMILDEKLQR